MIKNVLVLSKRLKQKRLFLRLFFVFLIFVCIFVLGLFALFRIGKFNIKEVRIEGVNVLSPEALVKEVEKTMANKFLGIFPRNRIFSVSEEEIKEHLFSKFPRLSQIKIDKQLPSVIFIRVTERQADFLLCGLEKESCLFLDEMGFIFEKAPFFSDGVFLKFVDERSYKPSLGQFLIEVEEFERVKKFIKKLESDYRVLRVRLLDDGVYEFYTTEGWYLILESRDDWNVVYDNFNIFLHETFKDSRKDLQYIDLRFGNKIFYKLK